MLEGLPRYEEDSLSACSRTVRMVCWPLYASQGTTVLPTEGSRCSGVRGSEIEAR